MTDFTFVGPPRDLNAEFTAHFKAVGGNQNRNLERGAESLFFSATADRIKDLLLVQLLKEPETAWFRPDHILVAVVSGDAERWFPVELVHLPNSRIFVALLQVYKSRQQVTIDR